jgi:hypothetical protein
MNGGGCLMAVRGVLRRKEKKKVFLSLFSLDAGGKLLSAPCQTCSGRGRAFFLPYLAQNRKDQTLTGWATGCCWYAFFRWRRTSPTFQVPQRVKFSPSGYRYCTDFDLALFTPS